MDEIQNTGMPAIYDDQLIEMAEKAEKRIDAIKKIKVLSLKVTNAHDWTSQQDKPYLQVSGSEKVARLWGISWRVDEPYFVNEEDGHFRFDFKGHFSLGNAEIEAIGTRSSKDGFFKRYTYEGEGKDKKKVELPPSEIDKGDVRKAAYTNCIGNGVTRLLGIRNLTWEDLKEAGIRKEDIGKVEYGKQEMSEGAVNQKEEIRRMILEMVNQDETKFGAALFKITSFDSSDGKHVPGKTKLEDLSEKALKTNYEKTKKTYEEWKKEHPNGTTGNSQPDPGGQA